MDCDEFKQWPEGPRWSRPKAETIRFDRSGIIHHDPFLDECDGQEWYLDPVDYCDEHTTGWRKSGQDCESRD